MEWKTLKEFNNYEANQDGEVRNKITNHLLTIDYSDRSGYARVTLYHNHKTKRYLLHRLVMN